MHIQRIPGAKYLDLDLIGDTSFSSAPHNLPKVDRFCEEMDRIGIQDTHTKIVVYDTLGGEGLTPYIPESTNASTYHYPIATLSLPDKTI